MKTSMSIKDGNIATTTQRTDFTTKKKERSKNLNVLASTTMKKNS
jgi:hypothetical protein